jgi:hypothetical protein
LAAKSEKIKMGTFTNLVMIFVILSLASKCQSQTLFQSKFFEKRKFELASISGASLNASNMSW